MDRCPPCRYLEELTGAALLTALHDRGGLRAVVRRGGTLRVGDVIVPTD